jgi:hypothetical protein
LIINTYTYSFLLKISSSVLLKFKQPKMSSSNLPEVTLEGAEAPREDTIRVVCRFRPLNKMEIEAESKSVVTFPAGQEESTVSVGVR